MERRVACLQMRSGRDVAANIDALAALAREAIGAGAHFAQSPEMSNLVARSRAEIFDKTHPEASDPMLLAARDLARAGKLHLHLGSIIVQEGDKLANRAILIGPEGEIVARYDKLHLFDVDLPNGESWRESATYHAGACGVVAPMGMFNLGLSICYDIRFAYLYRALAEAGAELLTAPACFTKQTGEAHWSVLQRARAIETGSFMVSAAQGGLHEDGRETYGHSIIIDPWGRVLAEAEAAPGILIADINPEAAREARRRIPVLQHGRNVSVTRIGPGNSTQQAAE